MPESGCAHMSWNAREIDGSERIVRFVPLLMAVACLAPFVPLVTREDAIISGPWRTYAAMHLPLAHFVRDELLAGRLPLWNPYLACGQPLMAAQQAMLFNPLSTPLIALCGANRGLEIAIFLHLGLCYAGVYRLARHVSLSCCGAAYAGVVVTWSGALTGHLGDGHAGAVFETALAPWFFLTLGELLTSPRASSSARLAVVGSLCALAAQPQVLYYLVAAGVYWTAGSLWLGAAARHRVRTIAWGVIAAVIAALIAAVQLIPVFELMRDGLAESERGRPQFATTYALEGADSARLLLPYLNGSPLAGVPQFDVNDSYHERVVYLGIAALPLAAYGLSRRGAARWQWAAALAVVVALAVAFGDATPAFRVFSRVLPGVLFFRCPGRIFLVASIPTALLAARGLDAWAVREPRAGRTGLLCALAVALSAIAVPAYAAFGAARSFKWLPYIQYVRRELFEHLSVSGMVAANMALLVLLAMSQRLRGGAIWLPMLALTAVDLGYFNVVNFRMEQRKPPPATEFPPADAKRRFIEAMGFDRIGSNALRYCRRTGDAMLAHRPAVGTYDGGVLPAATVRLYRAVESNPRPALAIAACGYAWPGSGAAAEHPDGALQRARFVADEFDVSHARLGEIADSDIATLRLRAVSVKLFQATPRRLEMEFTAPRDGWLIVADTYYPGWLCQVDGRPRQIERAHEIFRRVRINAGKHRVLMSYEPLSFRLGVIGTISGIMLAAAMVLSAHRHEKSQVPLTACEKPRKIQP